MTSYPSKFSNEARVAVERELIHAVREHEQRRREWSSEWPFPERQSLQRCILRVFLIYARETIELGKSRVWTVDQALWQALEGLRLLTLEICSKQNNYCF